MKPVQIKLTKNQIKQVNKFVKARCGEDTSEYKRRGGFKEIDIKSGAMAELAVFTFLKRMGFKVGKPDFTIHTTQNKSYDADLTDGWYKWHVKGQTTLSSKRYGHSWLMQRYDPLIKNPVERNYLVPCSVDIDTGEVWILAMPTFIGLHKLDCFGECKVPAFQRTKVAIYYDELKNKMSNQVLWSCLTRKRANDLKRERKYAV